jgi:hypothetical protein
LTIPKTPRIAVLSLGRILIRSQRMILCNRHGLPVR